MTTNQEPYKCKCGALVANENNSIFHKGGKCTMEITNHEKALQIASCVPQFGKMGLHLRLLHGIEQALDEAGKRGAERMREKAAIEAENRNADVMSESIAKRIRALPVEE